MVKISRIRTAVLWLAATVLLSAGSRIDVPSGASITVPSGAYLMADTINVSGTFTYYNITDVSVIPTGTGTISSFGPVFYVAATGSDVTGSGTSANPFATIQHGIDATSSGDTVNVAAGTYTEKIDFSGKNIVVIGADRETTIIDGNQAGSVVTIESVATASLENLTMQNGTGTDMINNGIMSGGGIIIKSSGVAITNCVIKDNTAIDGAGIYAEIATLLMDGCVVKSNSITTHGSGAGVKTHVSTVTIRNTLVADNQADQGGGLYFWGSTPTLDKVTIINNSTSDVGAGVFCYADSDPVITNSIIRNNNGPNQIYLGVGDNNDISIGYSNISYGIDSITVIGSSTVTDLGGIVDVDPMFVDTANGNYHLLASSQCINAGHPDSTDSDGSRADMGAYYYHNEYSGPTWYITESGNDTTATGASSDPFRSIQAGINFSSDADSVTVSAGTYVENINFRGRNIMVAGADRETTIIDGNQSGSVVTFVNGENLTSVLSGFTIQNGSINGSGGGIYFNNSSSPTITNITISNNTATDGGGIDCHWNSSPIITDVTITNNSASSAGGISCWYNSNPTLTNVTISGNTATRWGGGVRFNESNPTLTNVTISGNTVSGHEGLGGGVFFVGSTPILTNVTISGNTASNDGGGIWCEWNSNPILVNTILWNDSPQEIYFSDTGDSNTITISYSDIAGSQDSIITNDNGTVTWGSGNIDVDPMFVDSANGDYNLLADSPLIDAGHPDSTDADGSIADIGAYFYDQSGQPYRVTNIVTTPSSDEITVSWDAESVASSYNVYRSTDPDEDFYTASLLTNVSGTAYADMSTEENTTYYYRVGALDGDGDEGILGFVDHGRLGADSTALEIYNTISYIETKVDISEGDLTVEFYGRRDSSQTDGATFVDIGNVNVGLGEQAEGFQPYLEVYDAGGGAPTGVFSSITFTEDRGEWHHYAVTSDVSANQITLWIDGYNAASTSGLITTSGEKIYFGWNGESSNVEQIVMIDDVHISDTLRYSSSFIPPNSQLVDNQTVGLWKFNEGSWDSNLPAVYDLSGNGNHGFAVIGDEPTFVAEPPYFESDESKLVINEIMQNPFGADTYTEWIELHNRYFVPIHLENFILKDDGIESHTIGSDVKLMPGGYGVLGISADTSQNGGVVVDYAYNTGVFTLENGEDEVILEDGMGVEIDRVAYDNGATFPDPSSASMELISPYMDNNSGASWIEAITGYGSNGNLGSPGRKNDAYSGQIELSLASIDFGNVVEGETGNQDIIVRNLGVKELVLDSIATSLAEFTVSPSTGTVEPGDSLTISATFAPVVSGYLVDTIRVHSDDPATPLLEIAVEGMSVADAPDIVVILADNDTVTTYHFPDTRVGYPRTVTFELSNVGNQSVDVSDIQIDGSSAFTVSPSSATVGFLDSVDVTVTFDPAADGDYTATLNFSSNDPDEASYPVSLNGSAATNITLHVPNEFATIQAALDTAWSGDTVQVGAGTFTENIVFPSGDFVLRGEGADVTILDGNSNGAVITLNSSQSSPTQISDLTVTGGYAATGGGIAAYTASPVISHVIVYDNVATTSGGGIYLEGNATLDHVTVFGNSAQSAGSNGDGIYAGSGTVFIKNSILWNNGEQEIEATGATTLTYSIIEDDTWLTGEGNLNSDPLFVDSDNDDFSLSWGSPAIDAGDPSSPIDPDGSRADMGALPYTGGFPQAGVSGTALAFGDVLIGETGQEQVRLYNTGAATLHIDSLITNNPAFSVSTSSSRPALILALDAASYSRPAGKASLTLTIATIEPGDSLFLDVTFSMDDQGNQAGTLTVYSDDQYGNDQIQISLTGNMVAPIASFPAKSLTVVTFKPQNTDFTFSIENEGEYPLDYSIEVNANYFGFIWLDISQLTGQVAALATNDISVNVVSISDLDPGGYQGRLYLSTNSLTNGTVPASPVPTDTVDVYLNLLADSTQLTTAIASILYGNAPPVDVTDNDGNSLGISLDFINSNGGTVTVARIDAYPPVDASTPYTDPDGTISAPMFPNFYFEITTDIIGSFAVDIGFSYLDIVGIQNPDFLRMAKRVSNAGTAVELDIISASSTAINANESVVTLQNQTSFSQWSMLSNASANSFVDTEGPSITAISHLPDSPDEGQDLSVSATVSDANPIESATLHYAVGGNWTLIDVGMTVTGGMATAAIPGTGVTMNGLAYYISAADTLLNYSLSDTAYVEVDIADGSLTTNSVTSSAHASGIPLDKWRIIGPPAVLTDNNLTNNIGDELGTQSNDVWRMFSYNASTQVYAEKPTTFAAASSYWLFQRVTDNLHFALSAASTGDLEGTSITLVPGWTFISSPYPFPVNINLPQSDFYGPITYGEGAEDWSGVITTLKPWGGYALYNRQSGNKTITIQPWDQSSGLIAAKENLEDGWILNLKAQADEYADRNNRMGVLESAEDGLDYHDNPVLLPPGKYISMTYTNPAWGEDVVLTSDVRAVSDEIHVWDISLAANGIHQQIELTWDFEQSMGIGQEVRLIDLRTKKVVNPMLEVSMIVEQVRLEFPARLKAVAGPADLIESAVVEVLSALPQAFALEQNYPNPFNASTMVRFTLPEPVNVRLAVVNLLGQEVAELASGWYDMGFHEVRWDGLTYGNNPAASGIYFTVLTDGHAVRVKKLILMK